MQLTNLVEKLKSYETDTLVQTEYFQLLYSKIPEKYEDIPKLPEINGFKLLDINDVIEFFDLILTDDSDIFCINQNHPDNSCSYCDESSCVENVNICIDCNLTMCKECWKHKDDDRESLLSSEEIKEIIENTIQQKCICDYCYTYSDKSFKYCKKCNLYMCELCFSETNEDIARSKYWSSREKDLEECRKHEMIHLEYYKVKNNKIKEVLRKNKEKTDKCNMLLRNCKNHLILPRIDLENLCDSCKKELKFPYYEDLSSSINYCHNCINTSIKSVVKVIESEQQYFTLHRGYGSVLDWIPVYEDEYNNMILYNANPDSEKYGYFSLLSTDDHGRCGVQSLKIDIENLKEDLEKRYVKWIEDFNNVKRGWDKVYNVPIKTYLDDHGWEYHYG